MLSNVLCLNIKGLCASLVEPGGGANEDSRGLVVQLGLECPDCIF